MWKSVALVIAVWLGLIGTAAGMEPGAAPTLTYRPGAVLVRFRQQGTAGNQRATLARLQLPVERALPALGMISVAVPAGEESAALAILRQQPDVAAAELDYRAWAAGIPNDPAWPQQWALTRINAPAAWEVVTGTAAITIAVLDSGIDLAHPDLVSKLWTNPREIPGNGVDDDHNGQVDDVHGWHIFHQWTGSAYVPDQDGFVADDYGHGTHIAGIAGAATNNGIGVAGVAWDSPLMVVKVLDQYGVGWYSDIAAGIVYAADNGARIINMSLGGPPASDILCAAAAYAHDKGSLLVASTGNASTGSHNVPVYYPAACEYVLGIAATDASDDRASFSNAGPEVDLAAPGVDIFSTWYRTGTQTSDYFRQSGTSVAAPLVAGVAALVWSRWPALDADAVAQQLRQTAVDVGTPGWDAGTGWGRVDAAAAVGSQGGATDLQVRLTALPDPVIAGSPLTQTLVVTNAGASAATNLTLTATLASGIAPDVIAPGPFVCDATGNRLSCGLARLEPGAAVSVTAVVTPTIVGEGVLVAHAGVRAVQIELTPADNTATLRTAILPNLAGWVFLDANGDGQRQVTENQGIGGAWITVEQGGLPVTQTLAAAPGGRYQFDAIAPGRYEVSVGIPAGYQGVGPGQISLEVESGILYIVNFGVQPALEVPTATPTATPADTATVTPTVTPVDTPTATPTVMPVDTPTVTPTATPVATATVTLTPPPPASGRRYLPLLLVGWRG